MSRPSPDDVASALNKLCPECKAFLASIPEAPDRRMSRKCADCKCEMEVEYSSTPGEGGSWTATGLLLAAVLLFLISAGVFKVCEALDKLWIAR